MSRGPTPGQKTRVDFVAVAREAWGESMPAWVQALAEHASSTSGTLAAEKIGYSNAVVTQVCRNKYPGDLARVEAKVRGALMGETVMCPILGVIGRDNCLDLQKKRRTGASAIDIRRHNKCRGIGVPVCEHSRVGAVVETPLKETPR